MRDHRSVPLQRLMALRQYPGFADADFAELAVLGDNLVDEEHTAGSIVTRAGRVPGIHMITEGTIEMAGTTWGPRELVGALEAMAGRPIKAPMIATTGVRTLQLSAAELADILEDNLGLLSRVRRSLAQRVLRLRNRQHAIVATRPARPQVATATTGSMNLVDRLVALRHQRPFANSRIQALVALAQGSREVQFAAGTVVTREREPANSTLVILDGGLRHGARIIGPGDALGMIETLAERPHSETIEAMTPVRALECPNTVLFDVIEDHTELALAIISNLAGEILDWPPQHRAPTADLETEQAN